MPNEKPNIYAYPINVLNHKKFKLFEDETLKDLPETQYKCRLLEKSVEILRQAGVVEVPPVDKRSGLVTTKHGQFQVNVDDAGNYHIYPTPRCDEIGQDIVDAFNAERGIGTQPEFVDYSKCLLPSVTKNAFAFLPSLIAACENNEAYLGKLLNYSDLNYAINVLKRLKVLAIDNQP